MSDWPASAKALVDEEEVLDLAHSGVRRAAASPAPPADDDERSSSAALGQRAQVEAHFASLGRMTAGLAHELASPVMVLQAALDQLRSDRDAPHPDCLDDAQAALRRIAALVLRHRSLAQTPELRMERLDLADLARDVCAEVALAFPSVRFDVVISEEAVAECDSLRVAQILVNLARNAAQAASSGASPAVRLHVYRHRGLPVVSVRDNGPGIKASHLERIFEPFFTTRRNSGGLGLGLSLCREYAREMGMELYVVSSPGAGACFRLWFAGEKGA